MAHAAQDMIEYAVPEFVADPRDRRDIQWIVSLGRRHGAKLYTPHVSNLGDLGPPFTYSVTQPSPTQPHLYSIILSYARNAIVEIYALTKRIATRVQDSLHGPDTESILQVTNPATQRSEITIRYQSRNMPIRDLRLASTPTVDEGMEEPPKKRARTDA